MRTEKFLPAVVRAAGFAAVLHVAGISPAWSDDIFFSYLGTDAPAPSLRITGPVGTWTTTVIAEPMAGKAAAPVRVASAGPVATGSLPPSASKSGNAGLRLTGLTHALSGSASYYWQEQMTATGERFDKRAMTAAHKTLPFGTRVRVTRVDTGNSVVVRINDRGPFKPGRVIDLSERAAEEMGMTDVGVAPVKLEVLGR